MAGPDRFDLVVAGGGPAGLAVAAYAARAGLRVVVVERASGPPDKACGEGIMPGGVEVLRELGVVERLTLAEGTPFRGIRYVLRDGRSATGRLPAPGLGVRRTALTAALAAAAAAEGAELRFGCRVEGLVVDERSVKVATSAGVVQGSALAGADGLHSQVRRLAGLERPSRVPPRFGLRRHFRAAPWSELVEVYLGERQQMFVTPAGSGRVGVAVLWHGRRGAASPRLPDCLCEFPALEARLASAEPDSDPRGAGPLAQEAASVVADRIVLVGDAAGSVDAISGEGLALAFADARALGSLLPQALERGASRAALEPYRRAHRGRFAHYRWVCRLLLWAAVRPVAAGGIVGLLRRCPRLFDRLVRLALVG